MGSFLASVHVKSTDLQGIREILVARAAADGLRLAEEGEEEDHRVVLVGPNAAGWCSVYDPALEGQEAAVLDKLTKALSKSGAAFWLLVHDSDDLVLSLFEGGKRQDRYTSRRRRGPVDDHLAAWRGQLAAGQEEATLRAVFEHRGVFAEEALGPLGQALGLSSAALHGTSRDQEQDPTEGSLHLRFRAAAPATPDAPTGPPRLRSPLDEARAAGHPGVPEPRPVQAAVGGPVQLSLSVRNFGGPGRGIQVRVHSAAPSGVRWETAQLILGDPRERVIQEAPLTPGPTGQVADFPEARLAPGLSPTQLASPPRAPERLMKLLFSTQVHVNLRGVASHPGQSEVELALLPAEGEGSVGRTLVEVRSTDGRPLRAAPTVHPAQLAPLEGDSHLVGLAVLDRFDRDALRALAQTLARWVPAEGKVRTTRYARGALHALPTAPKLSSGAAAGFLTGKRFATLLDGLTEGASQISANWEPSAAHLEIGYGLLGIGDPALGVLFQIVTPDRQVDAALTAAWDGLAEHLVQGLVTRWAGPASLEMTPYELACGVMGQCTLDRPWVRRWLRGLGRGVLWMGPELASALGQPAAPQRRVIDDLPRAEEALAPLLPSAADWQLGVRQRFQNLARPS